MNEQKQKELLKRASELYPIGTVYLDVLDNNTHTAMTDPFFYSTTKNIAVAIAGGFVYVDGEWADYIDPETKERVSLPYEPDVKEMEAVATAIHIALKEGLETEVILWAMRTLKRNYHLTIEQALKEGINEWIK